MDSSRFDHFTRSFAGSRRSLVGGTLALSLGLIGSSSIDARKRRKRKKPKSRNLQVTLNEYGCVNVDVPCTSNDQCCSGVCEGTKGNRTCRAHDSSDCIAGTDVCSGEEVTCTTSSGEDGFCGTTTGNAGYCLATGDCYPCRTDVECQRARNGFFGPTAACLTCAECAQTGGTLCALARL